MQILQTVGIVALVIVGVVVLGILIRVVWFFIEVGVEISDVVDDKRTNNLQKRLEDPTLTAAELRSIAYSGRADADILRPAVAQHPKSYPGLTAWMDEVAPLSKRYGSKYSKAVKRFREPPLPEEATFGT